MFPQVQELVAPFVEALRRHVHESSVVLLVYQSRSSAVSDRRSSALGWRSWRRGSATERVVHLAQQVDTLLFSLLRQQFATTDGRSTPVRTPADPFSVRPGRLLHFFAAARRMKDAVLLLRSPRMAATRTYAVLLAVAALSRRRLGSSSSRMQMATAATAYCYCLGASMSALKNSQPAQTQRRRGFSCFVRSFHDDQQRRQKTKLTTGGGAISRAKD